jgi:hypothetical protein
VTGGMRDDLRTLAGPEIDAASGRRMRDGVTGRVAPFALALDDFIAAKGVVPDPLLGTEDDCILPPLGLGLLIARGGKGKTTFSLDLALHLASGIDYLGLAVQRSLRVLVIENEGPREPFRRKLERKRQSWPHEIAGAIHVYDENWGHARLDLDGFVERLNGHCREHDIDLVIGDPLDSLGMDGEGTPSETRAMVDRFKAAGLFTERAWWLPHHSRKESVKEAVDAASGAWGGRPDAMLALEKRSGNRARLSFAKIRWQARERKPYVLDFDPEAEAFIFVTEQETEERDYVVDAEEFLGGGKLATVKEIAAGISASQDAVREALKGNRDRFETLTREATKAAGYHVNANVWRLTLAQKSDESDAISQGELS